MSTTVVSDDFARTVGGGWGFADLGGPWSVRAGTAANFSVDGADGRVVSPAKKEQSIALAEMTTARDVEALMLIRQGPLPSGSDKPNVYVMLRWQPNAHYRVGVHTRSNGAVYLRAEATPGGKLFWEVPSGVTVTPGDTILLRARATGVDPTTVSARVWRLGTPEPGVWQSIATNSTSALQAAGRVGVSTLVNGSKPATIMVERLEARSG